MHFLFVKHELCFPRVSGHDVHTYWMMRSLFEAGHQISLLTVEAASVDAIEGVELKFRQQFDPTMESRSGAARQLGLSRLQQRFCSYWGVPENRIEQVADLAKNSVADAVVAVGLDVLPYLAGVQNAQRVWYAADEWVIHHLSQTFLSRPSTWSNVKQAVVKGLYERAFAAKVDRVWLVSERDAKWTRRIMPQTATDVIPNGVDTKYYSHQSATEIDRSCVFWGRLDFGPNLDALQWFGKHVWSEIRSQFHDARFTVYGFKPGTIVHQLASEFGFQLVADQADIRQPICAHQLVVLPFVSGAGIKNKLLEAASLSRPIIASTMALNGVDTGGWNPVQQAGSKRQWLDAIKNLWGQPAARRRLGQQARSWVMSDYTWDAAAKRVIQAMDCKTK